MDQGKGEKIERIVIIAFISLVVLLGLWVGVGIVTATQNDSQEEMITTQVAQSVEKYFDLEDNQVLLQQKIIVSTNKNEAKKERERLEIYVPMIQGKRADTVNVLADGKLVEDQFCHYDAMNNQLNLTINQSVSVYKVIYVYQEITAQQQEIGLYTKVHTKFEGVKEEVQAQDERTMDIKPVGEKISVQGEITEEVYKGYLYEVKENKTTYHENYMIEVSNTQNVEAMNLEREKEVFTYEVETGEGEEKTKIEKDTNDCVYYVKTLINKEQMLRILGEEGKIIIQNEQGETIQELTKDSQVDENGNIVVNYTDKEVKNVKVKTTKPVQLGEIKLYNEKVIDPNTGYEKEEIEKFENLESTIRVNESTNLLQMRLLNTKIEARLHMDKKNLSTLQKNENVQIMLTLQANSNQYALYKNPVIHVLLPEELDVKIKEITQLNFEEIMHLKSAEIKQDEEGRKILSIALEGEQECYSNQSNAGIQIAIVGDITISNMVPSKKSSIEVSCKNENIGGEEVKTQYPFKINSKYGVLMVNKIENYNQEQNVTETADDKQIDIPIDTVADAKKVKQTTQIINNYENPISQVCMIGNITEDKQAIDISLEEIIVSENKNAKIYYSDRVQNNQNSEQWKENKEEIEKVKSYKIVLEDEIQPGENFGIIYQLNIPENLNPESISYVKNSLTYENLDNAETTTSNIRFATKNQQVDMFSSAKELETGDMKIEVSAISGNQYLQDGSSVKEGQGIRYKIRVTNISQSDLSNIMLEATNTNAIYYDRISYEEDAFGVMVDKIKIEENEKLTAKAFTIDSLKSGETQEVSYQITVKEVADNNQVLTGQIKVKAKNHEEESIEHIRNPIEKGNIKATLRFLHSEDVRTYEGSDIPLSAKVTNISNQELHDVIVEVPEAEGFRLLEELLFITDETPYKLLSYQNKILKFKIPRIMPQETIKISMKFIAEQVDLAKTETTVSQYFKVYSQEVEYISNDIERRVEQSKVPIIAKQTTNRQEKNVKHGDQIKFLITIENKGVIEKDISITDEIPNGLRINSAKIKTSEKQKELEHNINLLVESVVIKANEIIELEIDTTVDTELMIRQDIENYVKIQGINVLAESNKVSFFIEVDSENGKDDMEQEEIEIKDKNESDSSGDDNNNGDDDNKDDNNEDDDNKNDNNNKDDDNENNNKDDEEDNNEDEDHGIGYNISGVAWVDTNVNGQQDDGERKISNMPVWLINEELGTQISEKTKEDGSYTFKNVKQGRYIVVFQYDTNKYTVTTYQKEGVGQEVNSDVRYQVMNIQNREVAVARTKTLELKLQDLKNIDAGFTEGKKFDLRLDKTIHQVTIQNSAGTKVNSYQQSKLAKVEIDAKQMANSNIRIQYNIAVTNQGEIAGYANEIVDYLPKDLLFSQKMNPSWYLLKDGSIATKELSNQMINPGETKNITLIVDKKMTQDNMGTVTNKARLEKYSNDYMVEETDHSNNESQADIIISVRTGRIILYLSLVITIIMIIACGIYFIKKKVL